MRVGVVRSRMRIEATEERPPCQSDFDLVRRNLARLVSCVGTAGIGTAAANARFLQGLGASIPRNVSNFAQFYLWDGLVLASSKGGTYVCCANSTSHIGIGGNVISKEMIYAGYNGGAYVEMEPIYGRSSGGTDDKPKCVCPTGSQRGRPGGGANSANSAVSALAEIHPRNPGRKTGRARKSCPRRYQGFGQVTACDRRDQICRSRTDCRRGFPAWKRNGPRRLAADGVQDRRLLQRAGIFGGASLSARPSDQRRGGDDRGDRRPIRQDHAQQPIESFRQCAEQYS